MLTSGSKLNSQPGRSGVRATRPEFLSLTIQNKEMLMNTPRFGRKSVKVIALAAMIMMVFATLARAESGSKEPGKGSESGAPAPAGTPKPKAAQSVTQYSEEELEQTRSDFLKVINSYRQIMTSMGMEEQVRNLDRGQELFKQLSAKELTVIRKGTPKLDDFHAAAENLRMATAEMNSGSGDSLKVQKKHKGDGTMTTMTAGFPNVSFTCSASPVSFAALTAADTTFFVADGVREAAQDACKETLVVLGEGGNTSLACIAVDAIWIAAKVVQFAIHVCADNETGDYVSANYDRLGHIHSDLESSVSNDNTNKNTIVANDNTNKGLIIAEVDAKATALSSQISAGTTDILNRIDSKAADIINNDNTNRTQIINNDNTNTANIITNDNANKTAIINNDNTNFAATINELRGLGCDIIRLLNTPDGLKSSSIASCTGKPGWPYVWGRTTTASASVAPASATVGGTADATTAAAPAFSSERSQDGVPIVPVMGTVTMERYLLDGKLVPTYYLPASRGGMIEQVKLLVWNTIGAQLDLSIAKAETEEAKDMARHADELLARKMYVEAYRQYSAAYQKLVPAN